MTDAHHSESTARQAGNGADHGAPKPWVLRPLPEALTPLTALPHWCCWRWKKQKNGKWTKPPSGDLASSDNPATWTTYARVVSAFNAGGYSGIGWFFDENVTITVFDVDDCRDPDTGLLHYWAQRLVERCNTYAEVTISGTGIRIIGTSAAGGKFHTKKKVGDAGVSCELYRKLLGRYIVVTGDQIPGTPNHLADIGAVMDEVAEELNVLNNRNDADADADADTEDDEASRGTEELPHSAIVKLHIPNLGAGVRHAVYDSRHELLFAFITELLCARIGAAAIKAACLDSSYRGIAVFEHCLEKGGRAYVTRQNRQARIKLNESLDAEVTTINKTHALVLSGNKASVMKFEKIDGNDQFRLLQVGAFKTWFANQQLTVGKKVMALGDFWITHRDRRQYEGIEFAPTRARDGYYNMWRGFTVAPRPGDCSKFLGHLKDNIASGNEAHYKWIVGWFAQIFQELDIKMGTSLCLRGKQGVGKTKVGEVIGALMGNHYELVSDPRYIVGQFNSHMAGLLLLHADEAFWAGDRKAEGKLKDLVTGKDHRLEYKNVEPIKVRNLIRLFVCGNHDWVVPTGFGERRFAIFDVGEGKIKNNDYFAAIDEEMKNGGREALLHHLPSFDLSQVKLRVIPNTEALLEQIVESATPEQAWWFDTLKSGELPCGISEVNRCLKRSLYLRYVQHAQLQGVRRRSIAVKIGMFLSKYVGPNLKMDEKQTYTIRRGGHNVQDIGWIYTFPSLWECRQRFASEMQQPITWGADPENTQWKKEALPVLDDNEPF